MKVSSRFYVFQDGIQKYFKTYLIPIFNPCFRETKFNLGFEYEIDNSHFKILFNLRQTFLIFRKLDKIQFQFHFKIFIFYSNGQHEEKRRNDKQNISCEFHVTSFCCHGLALIASKLKQSWYMFIHRSARTSRVGYVHSIRS